jgi:hypothetical protein
VVTTIWIVMVQSKRPGNSSMLQKSDGCLGLVYSQALRMW